LGHEAAWNLQNVGGLDTKGLPEEDSTLIFQIDRPENPEMTAACTSRRSVAAKNSSSSSYPTANAGKWLNLNHVQSCLQNGQENKRVFDSHIARAV